MRKIIHRIWRNTIIDDVYSYMTKNKHPNSYKVQNCRFFQNILKQVQATKHKSKSWSKVLAMLHNVACYIMLCYIMILFSCLPFWVALTLKNTTILFSGIYFRKHFFFT